MRTSMMLLVVAMLAAHGRAQPTFNDVQYGVGPRDAGGVIPLTMDLYLPSGAPAATPVVVWIHGGGWSAGSNQPIPGFASQLVGQGVAVASVTYRLSGDAIAPAQIHDVKGAVRFLRANAAFCTLLGRTAEELAGLPHRDVVHEAERDENCEALSRAIQRGESVFRTERRYLRRDATPIIVDLTISRDLTGARALLMLPIDELGTPTAPA